MTSFNHYALGAIADWLHRTVAGLAPAEPGYRKFEIRPVPGDNLTSASARLNTPYGPAESAWKIADGHFQLDVVLPPNTTGAVTLPGQPEPFEIGSGRYHWSIPYPGEKDPRVPLSLDMSIGELIDYPEAFKSIMRLFSEFNPDIAARLETQTSLNLRQAAYMLQDPEEILPRMSVLLKQAHE
jgi:alpha-L-rhamnosidase